MWTYAPAFAVREKPQQHGGITLLAKALAVAAVAVFTAPPAAAQPPIIGAQGLVPNAKALAEYIASTYPGVKAIGGWRAQDPYPDHPSGRAIDVMVGADTALGNAIAADVRSQSDRFGVQYLLWQVVDHGDHVHITVRG